VQWEPSALDTLKFGSDPLLGWVHDHRGPRIKNEVLNLQKAKEAAMGHFLGIDLPDLALTNK
jgi:hypothetical protein